MEWYWAFALLLGMVVSFMAIGIPVAFAFIATNFIAVVIFVSTAGLIQVVDNSTQLDIRMCRSGHGRNRCREDLSRIFNGFEDACADKRIGTL